MERLLKSIYYDPSHPASFGGVERLSRATKIPLSATRNWLSKQETYTLHKPVRVNYSRRKTIALFQGELFQSFLNLITE